MSNPSPPTFTRLLPWALAGLLAVAVVWLSVRQSLLRAERESLRTDRQFAETAAALARSQLGERSLLAEGMINQLSRKLRHAENLARLRIAILIPPADQPSGARAIVVWDPEQAAGWLTSENLPPLADTEDYQIWIGSEDRPAAASGGVFHPVGQDRQVQDFRPTLPIENPTTFIVSREPKGGRTRMEGPILLSGK